MSLVASEVTIKDSINMLSVLLKDTEEWFLVRMDGIIVDKVRSKFAEVLGEIKVLLTLKEVNYYL